MARPLPDLNERLRRSKLKRYLLADETVILAQHQHWASFGEPLASAVAGFLVAFAFLVFMPGALTNLLWWAWFFLLARAFWKWVLWRREWLVATDKRLLVNYGLVNQGVAMISLARVVDLTYTRSTLGQILGYGTLERESQKQPHSLHEIRWVKNPHATYLTICAAIFDLQDRMFGMDDDEDEHDHRFEDGPPPHTPGLYADYVPGEERTGPTESPVERRGESEEDPAVIQIKYGATPKRHKETWRPSPDLRESVIRDADTGPIPYRRSTTDEGDGWDPTTNDPDHH